ncbi:FAD-binding oxidoreductase [Acinetobacter lactucae]
MKYDVLILGAGIVGVSCALHLQLKGKTVALVDRGLPGDETSFGNAGIIQREAIRPYNFPHNLSTIFQIALNSRLDIRYHFSALGELIRPLITYYHNSSNKIYPKICDQYEQIIARSLETHTDFIYQSNVMDLMGNNGWIELYRTNKNLDQAIKKAEEIQKNGIRHKKLDGQQLKILEPTINGDFAGAIHWLDPITIKNPGNLVKAYANLFQERGGDFFHGNALDLKQDKSNKEWQINDANGQLIQATEVVIALGPWSTKLTEKFGYKPPLFIKRGYHMHYSNIGDIALNRTVLDAERGYLIAPMEQGLRLITGAELTHLDAPATPNQLHEAEIIAQKPSLSGID